MRIREFVAPACTTCRHFTRFTWIRAGGACWNLVRVRKPFEERGDYRSFRLDTVMSGSVRFVVRDVTYVAVRGGVAHLVVSTSPYSSGLTRGRAPGAGALGGASMLLAGRGSDDCRWRPPPPAAPRPTPDARRRIDNAAPARCLLRRLNTMYHEKRKSSRIA